MATFSFSSLDEGKGNFYDEFNVVPGSLLDKLRQGKVLIRNWHGLNWETEEKLARKKTVDKRGAKSDEAYVKEVLGEIATARSLVVINDEAHHAWRIPAESKVNPFDTPPTGRGLLRVDGEQHTNNLTPRTARGLSRTVKGVKKEDIEDIR